MNCGIDSTGTMTGESAGARESAHAIISAINIAETTGTISTADVVKVVETGVETAAAKVVATVGHTAGNATGKVGHIY